MARARVPAAARQRGRRGRSAPCANVGRPGLNRRRPTDEPHELAGVRLLAVPGGDLGRARQARGVVRRDAKRLHEGADGESKHADKNADVLAVGADGCRRAAHGASDREPHRVAVVEPERVSGDDERAGRRQRSILLRPAGRGPSASQRVAASEQRSGRRRVGAARRRWRCTTDQRWPAVDRPGCKRVAASKQRSERRAGWQRRARRRRRGRRRWVGAARRRRRVTAELEWGAARCGRRNTIADHKPDRVAKLVANCFTDYFSK